MARDLNKWLMLKTKAELQRLLRQVGTEANVKLEYLKSSGLWERLPLPTRNLLNTWTCTNKGKFFVAPRGRKKKELVLYIRQAMAFNALDTSRYKEDEEIPEEFESLADKFQAWYDPSEFWQPFWNNWHKSAGAEETMTAETIYYQRAIELLAECETWEEWYRMLNEQAGVWL